MTSPTNNNSNFRTYYEIYQEECRKCEEEKEREPVTNNHRINLRTIDAQGILAFGFGVFSACPIIPVASKILFPSSTSHTSYEAKSPTYSKIFINSAACAGLAVVGLFALQFFTFHANITYKFLTQSAEDQK